MDNETIIRSYRNWMYKECPTGVCPCCKEEKDGIVMWCSDCWKTYTYIRDGEDAKSSKWDYLFEKEED